MLTGTKKIIGVAVPKAMKQRLGHMMHSFANVKKVDEHGNLTSFTAEEW